MPSLLSVLIFVLLFLLFGAIGSIVWLKISLKNAHAQRYNLGKALLSTTDSLCTHRSHEVSIDGMDDDSISIELFGCDSYSCSIIIEADSKEETSFLEHN